MSLDYNIEVGKLKEQITELRVSQNNFRERLIELSSQNNNHFDRLFREIEKVQKTMEGINHITLQMTIQEKILADHDKKIALLEKEIKDTINFDSLTRKMIEEHVQEDRVKRETTKQNITVLEKIFGLLKWAVPVAVGILAAKLPGWMK